MRRSTLSLIAVVALLLGAACRTTGMGEDEDTLSRPARPRGQAPDADLLALLPDGAHLVATVDLEGLRRVARGRPWAKGVAETGAPLAGRLPGALGHELLARAKVLVLGLWMEESGIGQILLLARGGPEPVPAASPPAGKTREPLGALVRSRLQGPSPKAGQGQGKAVEWERYRGVDLARTGQEATALPTPRTVVAGPLPLVKHSLDLLREVPGFSSVREDRELMALWRLVTGPAEGRAPALALVSRFPTAMRVRLSARLGIRPAPLRAGLRVSAAEWVTVRAFVDCQDKASAQAAIEGLERAVGRAARTDLFRQLKLAPLVKLLAVHQEGARVHGQWLAPLVSLDPYLTRIVGLLGLKLPADRPQAFPRPKDP